MRKSIPFLVLTGSATALLILLVVFGPTERTSVTSEPAVAEEPTSRPVLIGLPWAFVIEESRSEDCFETAMFVYEKGETVSWRENQGEFAMKFQVSKLNSWNVGLTYLSSRLHLEVGQTLHWVKNGLGAGLAFRIQAIDRYGRFYLVAGCDSEILDKLPIRS